MITCLILGMGIPTIPNYIITSSIAGPALLQLGVPLIVSHMFVFYFGIMADLTPPVALAAFAAAPIARAPAMKIGIQAVQLAVAGFVVPYMAVYTPALMLQDGGPLAIEIGYPAAVAYVIVKAVLSIALWGAAAIGHLFRPLGWLERLIAAAAAFLLVVALPLTDELGFVARRGLPRLAGLALADDRRQRRHERALPRRRRCQGPPRGRGVHPRLDPFGREDRLAGGLADRAGPARPRRRRVSRAAAPAWRCRKVPFSRMARGTTTRTCHPCRA